MQSTDSASLISRQKCVLGEYIVQGCASRISPEEISAWFDKDQQPFKYCEVTPHFSHTTSRCYKITYPVYVSRSNRSRLSARVTNPDSTLLHEWSVMGRENAGIAWVWDHCRSGVQSDPFVGYANLSAPILIGCWRAREHDKARLGFKWS